MRYSLYVDKDRWMHGLHPGTKLLALLSVFAVAAVLLRPAHVLVPFCVVLVAPFTTGVAGAFRKFAFPLVAVGLLCFVLWAVFAPTPADARPCLTVFGLELSRDALLFAAAMTMRILTMIMVGVLFFATTTFEEFCAALMKMGLPQPVAFAVALSLRLFPTFVQNAFRILDAQRSRGLRLAGNPLRRVLAYVPLIIPVFVNSVERMHRLSLAIETRGYRPGRRRTSILEFRFGIADVLVLLFCLGGLACAVVVRVVSSGAC